MSSMLVRRFFHRFSVRRWPFLDGWSLSPTIRRSTKYSASSFITLKTLPSPKSQLNRVTVMALLNTECQYFWWNCRLYIPISYQIIYIKISQPFFLLGDEVVFKLISIAPHFSMKFGHFVNSDIIFRLLLLFLINLVW